MERMPATSGCLLIIRRNSRNFAEMSVITALHGGAASIPFNTWKHTISACSQQGAGAPRPQATTSTPVAGTSPCRLFLESAGSELTSRLSFPKIYAFIFSSSYSICGRVRLPGLESWLPHFLALSSLCLRLSHLRNGNRITTRSL